MKRMRLLLRQQLLLRLLLLPPRRSTRTRMRCTRVGLFSSAGGGQRLEPMRRLPTLLQLLLPPTRREVPRSVATVSSYPCLTERGRCRRRSPGRRNAARQFTLWPCSQSGLCLTRQALPLPRVRPCVRRTPDARGILICSVVAGEGAGLLVAVRRNKSAWKAA